MKETDISEKNTGLIFIIWLLGITSIIMAILAIIINDDRGFIIAIISCLMSIFMYMEVNDEEI